MATRRISDFLAGNRIPYAKINHTCAFTAQEVAESSHVPGRYLAKSVIVSLNGRLAIVAVPANSRVDLDKLREATCAGDVRVAEEAEFREEFDGCQVGTVPPFGNLFGVDTFVDRQLAREEHIAFNAGTHTDVFVVRFPDYVRLVQPRLIDVAIEPKTVAARSKRRSRRSESPVSAELWESESVLQAECGCPIVPMGAD